MGVTLLIPDNLRAAFESETIALGSSPGADVRIDNNPQVLPHHAVIRKLMGRWIVEVKEAEAIQVGDARPARMHWLKPGDVIRLTEGGPEIVFEPAETAQTAAPRAPAPAAPVSAPPRIMPVARAPDPPAASPPVRQVSASFDEIELTPVKDAPRKPTPARGPLADTPLDDEPADDVPLLKEPLADKPSGGKRFADPFDEPLADEPAEEEPLSDEPLSDAPRGRSGRDKPSESRSKGDNRSARGARGSVPADDDDDDDDDAEAAAEEIPMLRRSAPEPYEELAPRESSGQSNNTLVLAGVAGGVCIAVVLVVVFSMNGGTPPEESAPIGAAAPTGEATPARPGAPQVATTRPAPTRAAPSRAIGAKRAGDVDKGLYAVLVKHPREGKLYRLGTAWAVSRQQLVTSGAVAAALDELRGISATPLLMSVATQAELPVTAWRAHPEYRRATQELLAARSELQRLPSGAGTAKPDDKSAEQVQQIRDRIEQARREQMRCDLGTIDVSEALRNPLPLADPSAVALTEKVVLAGAPFSLEVIQVNPQQPLQSLSRAGNVATDLPADDTNRAGQRGRIAFRVPSDLAHQNWSGSPILDESWKVVAVYSGPMGAGAASADKSVAHAGTLVDRLREFSTNAP